MIHIVLIAQLLYWNEVSRHTFDSRCWNDNELSKQKYYPVTIQIHARELSEGILKQRIAIIKLSIAIKVETNLTNELCL